MNPPTATQRIKNHLTYKLGLALIEFDKARKAKRTITKDNTNNQENINNHQTQQSLPQNTSKHKEIILNKTSNEIQKINDSQSNDRENLLISNSKNPFPKENKIQMLAHRLTTLGGGDRISDFINPTL